MTFPGDTPKRMKELAELIRAQAPAKAQLMKVHIEREEARRGYGESPPQLSAPCALPRAPASSTTPLLLMSEQPFKPGDKVRCTHVISRTDRMLLVVGQIYMVQRAPLKIQPDEHDYTIHLRGIYHPEFPGVPCYFSVTNFVPAPFMNPKLIVLFCIAGIVSNLLAVAAGFWMGKTYATWFPVKEDFPPSQH